MKTNTRLMVLTALFNIGWLHTTNIALANDSDSAIVNTPQVAMNWNKTKAGVAFAPRIRDRFIEPYMAMVQLPTGLVSSAHMKTANMFGVVISGTITRHAANADTTDTVPLPAGSFYKIPAGLAHVSTCISTTDCVTFLVQDGKFDFLALDQ